MARIRVEIAASLRRSRHGAGCGQNHLPSRPSWPWIRRPGSHDAWRDRRPRAQALRRLLQGVCAPVNVICRCRRNRLPQSDLLRSVSLKRGDGRRAIYTRRKNAALPRPNCSLNSNGRRWRPWRDRPGTSHIACVSVQTRHLNGCGEDAGRADTAARGATTEPDEQAAYERLPGDAMRTTDSSPSNGERNGGAIPSGNVSRCSMTGVGRRS